MSDDISTTPPTKAEKLKLIKNHLKSMKKYKNAYYERFRKLKRRSQFIEAVLVGLSAITTSSIIIMFMASTNILILVALISSISTVGSVIARVYDLPSKYHSAQTSYLQYADLYRDIRNRIARNHLNSEDYDLLLTEINSRLGLIEDQCLPLKLDLSGITKPEGQAVTFSPVI